MKMSPAMPIDLVPKQKVLKKWPEAEHVLYGRRYFIYAGVNWDARKLGSGKTPEIAWADAARRLKGKR